MHEPASDKVTLPPGVLVDKQIREAIELKWLTIEPFDPDALEPATYDLRVGDIAAVSTATKPIDLREQPFLTIEPFASAVLPTYETLSLSPRLVGRLGPRSNILRHGIFVSTGPQIDPGFQGRLFVNLLNITEHPFLIRHHERFLTVEFHALSEEPSRTYSGPYQGKMELDPDEINRILSRGGPAFREIHRDLLELQSPIREVAGLGKELPQLVNLQQDIVRELSELLRNFKDDHLTRPHSITIPITTLVPAPFKVIREIPIVVQPADEGFTATFFDANISTSGDTQEEALENVKSLLVDLLDDLEKEPAERLGPEPMRQLKVLKAFMRRTT